MRKLILLCCLSVIFSRLCLSLSLQEKLIVYTEKNPQPLPYLIISQNNEIIRPFKDSWYLKKEPFEINIVMNKEQWLAVNISEDPFNFNYVSKYQTTPAIIHRSDNRINETSFNPESQLILNKEGLSLWLYGRLDVHGFNKLKVLNNRIIGTRIVQQLKNDREKTVCPIQKIPFKNLYIILPTYYGNKPYYISRLIFERLNK